MLSKHQDLKEAYNKAKFCSGHFRQLRLILLAEETRPSGRKITASQEWRLRATDLRSAQQISDISPSEVLW